MKIPNLKTHMTWTIVLLTATLFGTLSVKWSSLEDIPTIISIALGLSSLVLALVAIGQAVFSGNTLSISLGKIEAAAERALKATEAVDASAVALANRATMFEEIPPSLAEIREKIDNLSEMNSAQDVEQTRSAADTRSDSSFDQFEIYKRGATGTNVALYIASLSLKTSKSFNPIDILPDQRYVAGITTGYLIGLRSTGVIDMEYVSGDMIVVSMGPFSADVVENILIDSIKGTSLEGLKARIDEFFGMGAPDIQRSS